MSKAGIIILSVAAGFFIIGLYVSVSFVQSFSCVPYRAFQRFSPPRFCLLLRGVFLRISLSVRVKNLRHHSQQHRHRTTGPKQKASPCRLAYWPRFSPLWNSLPNFNRWAGKVTLTRHASHVRSWCVDGGSVLVCEIPASPQPLR